MSLDGELGPFCNLDVDAAVRRGMERGAAVAVDWSEVRRILERAKRLRWDELMGGGGARSLVRGEPGEK